jgi:hypothetical protein
VFVYFKSIENREFVRSIIDKVADTLCADRYYELYDEEEDTDVNLYDEESLPKTDESLPKAELNYEDESLYVNASEAAAIAKAIANAKPPVNTATLGNGFTFTYDEKVIEEIEANEYVEVYSNVVVVKSNNPKFKAGAKIEQISVSVALHFEYADGREY